MIYLDASALVKLIFFEPESMALTDWLEGEATNWVSSSLAMTELVRSTMRYAPEVENEAWLLLDCVDLLPLTDTTLLAAARLPDPLLGSLDAIHLATALEVGSDLGGFVTYDKRLSAAATAAGLVVTRPGQ